MRKLVAFLQDIEDDVMVPWGMMDLASDEASGLIKQYNNNVLKLQKYDENSQNNPAVINLRSQQEILKSSIISSVSIRLTMIDDKIDMARRNKAVADAQLRIVPEKQVEINSVEQMKGIK